MPVEALHCPSCGAAIADDAARCQYCGAALTIAGEPGVEVVQTPGGNSSGRSCPECHGSLTDVHVGSITIEECAACAGLWVRAEDFDQLRDNAQTRTEALHLPLHQTPGDEFAVRYYKCPDCGELMNRVNYARTSGVIVNTCPAHGIWFDHDGLRRVIEFLGNGGLDRASGTVETATMQEQSQEERLAAQAQFFNNLPSPQRSGTGTNRYLRGGTFVAISTILSDLLR
jgi:Zn-finger nucleic acid-binding protein